MIRFFDEDIILKQRMSTKFKNETILKVKHYLLS